MIQAPELVQQCQERVAAVRQRLLTAQRRQKSYVDVRQKDLEFAAGDFGHGATYEFSVSSVVRRAEQEDHSDLGRYVEGLLSGLEGKLSRVRPFGRVSL